MKIGCYQFPVTGNITTNMETIKKAIVSASNKDIRLIVFPECSLTGYPPLSVESCKKIDFIKVENCFDELQNLAIKHNIFIIIGSVTKNDKDYYNSALLFSPDGLKVPPYHKRALWGWDKDNFTPDDNIGIFKIDGFKIGLRICFEVRFPEYFRELYKSKTDFNIVIFYDVSNNDDIERYELIKSHLKTRAVENTSKIISVNTISPYQTAPTAVFDSYGKVLLELPRNLEGLLIYDFEPSQLSFGEQGLKFISDSLLK